MRVVNSLLLACVLLLTGACQSQPPQQQQPPPASSGQQQQGATAPKESSPTPPDVWNRSLECADRGERLAKRVQQDFATGAPQMASVNNWTTHYNPRRERCYVEITMMGRSPFTTRKEVPLLWSLLYDAVENVDIASQTPPAYNVAGGYCYTADNPRDRDFVDCPIAKQFIDQRMRE